MGELSGEALRVAVALLPGFLSVKIRDFFRTSRSAAALDRFFEIVAFSMVNYLVAGTTLELCRALASALPRLAALFPLVGRGVPSLSTLGIGGYLYVLASSALLLGLVAGFVVGHDIHYRLARRFGWTYLSGRSDVWQDVFVDVAAKWLVLHMDDGRRLRGWAEIYSEAGEAPAVYLKNAAWVEADGSTIPIDGEGVLVTELARIRYVEFRGEGS